MITTPTRSLLCALTIAACAFTGALLSPSPAHADLLEEAGLTGGSNRVVITEVLGKGRITFNTKNTSSVNAAISTFEGPMVKAEVHCKRSGYRCARLEGTTTQTFDAKSTKESGQVRASLAVKGKKAEAQLLQDLQSACKAGQSTIRLNVTVKGWCTKVKTAIGKKNYKPSASAQQASFALQCK